LKKTKYLIVALIGITALIISACSNNEDNELLLEVNDALYSASLYTNLRINKDVFDEINYNRINGISKGANYTIKNVIRENDFIILNLTYSGGCKQHLFEIIWDGIVFTDDPCHMNLLLIHDDNNDSCEALVDKTIIINLEELMGDVIYKDTCSYYLYNTFNFNESADVVIKPIN